MKPQENAHNLAKPFDFTHCETARITLRHGPFRSAAQAVPADEMGRFGAVWAVSGLKKLHNLSDYAN